MPARRYARRVEFRARLLSTLRQLQPVLNEPGVLVAGSEVPNLLEQRAASTLVVSEDVDIAVPVTSHASVKRCLASLSGFRPSPEEPSVWLPDDPALIEVNFIGLDRRLKRADESYVLEDTELPLLVFGQLSLLEPDVPLVLEGVSVPLPRKAGLIVEKLFTERSGEKGDRDLLVVAGLLQLASDEDLEEVVRLCADLEDEALHNVESNLTLLSLLPQTPNMPDPTKSRAIVARLLRALDRVKS